MLLALVCRVSREELLVEGESSAELQFQWTPGAEGPIREAVELRVDGRYSLGLFLIGTAVGPKKVATLPSQGYSLKIACIAFVRYFTTVL